MFSLSEFSKNNFLAEIQGKRGKTNFSVFLFFSFSFSCSPRIRMNASFVLLFLSLVSLSFSSHCPGTETEFIRQDCSLFTFVFLLFLFIKFANRTFVDMFSEIGRKIVKMEVVAGILSTQIQQTFHGAFSQTPPLIKPANHLFLEWIVRQVFSEHL